MRKIIKIKEDHYVIVDDSEIKFGDWFLTDDKRIEQSAPDWNAMEWHRKITYSTQPLEDVIGLTNKLDAKGWVLIKPIYVHEIKELIGEVDVEKKAIDYRRKYPSTDGDISFAFYDGYNQALEDNKEKKYTEDDLWKAVNCAYVSDGTWQECVDFVKEQVLQPKTEWEVEIVDGKLKLK